MKQKYFLFIVLVLLTGSCSRDRLVDFNDLHGEIEVLDNLVSEGEV